MSLTTIETKQRLGSLGLPPETSPAINLNAKGISLGEGSIPLAPAALVAGVGLLTGCGPTQEALPGRPTIPPAPTEAVGIQPPQPEVKASPTVPPGLEGKATVTPDGYLVSLDEKDPGDPNLPKKLAYASDGAWVFLEQPSAPEPKPEEPSPSPTPKPPEPTPKPTVAPSPVPPTPTTEPPPPPVPAPTEAPKQPPEGASWLLWPGEEQVEAPNFDDGTYFKYSNWNDAVRPDLLTREPGFVGTRTLPTNPPTNIKQLVVRPSTEILGYGRYTGTKEGDIPYAVFKADVGGGQTVIVKLIYDVNANLCNIEPVGGGDGHVFKTGRFDPRSIVKVGRSLIIHCKDCTAPGEPVPSIIETGLVETIGGT